MVQGALGRDYADGEIIVRQGDAGDCMFVIQQGEVEVLIGGDVSGPTDSQRQWFGEVVQRYTDLFPEIIATANIGCQLHLSSRANTPVKHWIELLDAALV